MNLRKVLIVILSITVIVAGTLFALNDRIDRENDQRTAITYDFDYDDIVNSFDNESNVDLYEQISSQGMTLKRGTIDNEIYANEYFDISFPMPDELIYLDDKEVATVFELNSQDFISDRKTSVDTFEKNNLGNCIDLVFYLPDGLSYTIITFINPGYYSSSSLSNMETALTVTENAMKTDPVLPCVTVTRSKVEYGGYEYDCLTGEITAQKMTNLVLFRKYAGKFIKINVIYYNSSNEIKEEFLNSIHNYDYQFSKEELDNMYGLSNNIQNASATDAISEASTPTEAQVNLERGYVDGHTYYNDSMNIKISLPENIYVLTDKELAESCGITSLYEDDNALSIQEMEITSFGLSYDNLILFPSGSSMVFIQYFNKRDYNLGYDYLDCEEFAQLAADTYSSDPMYSNVKTYTREINGFLYYCAAASLEADNSYEEILYRLQGDYVIKLALLYTQDDTTDMEAVINSITTIN